MSTIDLKERVLKKIATVKEDYLLEEVLALIEFETNTELLKLTKDQKSAVDEASEQLKNGEYHTNEEVENEIDLWLNA
ncbi:hypothetical protein [uncultured Arcticibacterium sp.]|uniref:hypothetical protein n=1 Tax=uncultured Arcticibacterium sp. TaxID=2173042 RepID=UPI0030FCCD4B